MSRSEEVIDSSPDRSVVCDLNPKLNLSMRIACRTVEMRRYLE